MEKFIRLIWIVALIFLQACAGAMARREEAQFEQELKLKDEAWIAARLRLNSMCPKQPTGITEYKKGVQVRHTGSDPFQGCDYRLWKFTNSPYTDDWTWRWLPAHAVIVQVHEEEARKRFTLKIYEEYMLAAARHLANAIDAGEITPEEHRALFNYAWTWMIDQTKNEAVLLRANTIKADEQDARIERALRSTGLALAAGLQAYALANARAYRPPTNCYGQILQSFYTVSCY